MYDWCVFKSRDYDFPVITVGNISAGGTGKSPFVGYLVGLLQGQKRVSMLSRGYGRKTKGFQFVKTTSIASEVGDEPLQLKQSFPKTEIAVDADRRNGIEVLCSQKIKPEVIILDDAFQHRKVKGGFQVVLTAYYNLYTNDYPLPAGDLREPVSAVERADVIIVTKCPLELSNVEQREIIAKLNPKINQKVYFTAIQYDEFVYSETLKIKLSILLKEEFCLVTGIATPKPLLEFLNKQGARYIHSNFPDHHLFSSKEIDLMALNKIILTTQKDYMRLQNETRLKGKLFYLPIGISFLNKEEDFKEQLFDFVIGD